ncbi:MAG: hypothetical protein K2J48_01020 [Muribaculaceae bacterium]|nr:hypothetical protein [Muribaculaceae bacterium]
MRIYGLYTIIILALICASCKPSFTNLLLDEAASMMDTYPDSAFNILQTMNPDELKNDEQRMYQRLLIIEVKDKLYYSPENDNEIREIMEYFIVNKKEDKLYSEIYYYAGRVYSELREDAKALEYFDKALRCLKKYPNLSLENRIHAQKGGVYSIHNLGRHSLKEILQHVKLTDSLYNNPNCRNHLKERIGARLSLASVYRQVGMSDSVWNIYNFLEKPVRLLNDSVTTSIFHSQLMSTYIYEGDYEKADSILKLHKFVYDYSSKSSVLCIVNDAKNRLTDSILNKEISEELLNNADLAIQYKTAKALAKRGIRCKNGEDVLKYAIKTHEIVEKIQKEYNENSLAEMEEIIDHARLENENLLLTLSNQRKEQWLTILILSSLLLIAIIAGLYIRSRFKQVKGNLEIERLKNENSRQIRELEDKINILNKKISDSDQVGEIDSERRKADELKKNLDLAKITERIMNSLTSRGAKITDTDLLNLRKCISGRYPGFLQTLLDMGVSNDNIVDAMFIKINVPQKMCAAYFRITSSGISNSRRRLFDKHCADTDFKNWKDFILSLGEKKD